MNHQAKATAVADADVPTIKYRMKSHESTIGSVGDLGRCRMMSRSGLLNPSAVAGKPSVTKFTQSCTGTKSPACPTHSGDEDAHNFANVQRNHVSNECFGVVVNSATFSDGGNDGGKVIVGENHISYSMFYAAVREPMEIPMSALFQSRGVVDAIASHSDDVLLHL